MYDNSLEVVSKISTIDLDILSIHNYWDQIGFLPMFLKKSIHLRASSTFFLISSEKKLSVVTYLLTTPLDFTGINSNDCAGEKYDHQNIK